MTYAKYVPTIRNLRCILLFFRISKMSKKCSIVGCNSTNYCVAKKRYFCVPAVPSNACDNTRRLIHARRQKWLKVINRQDTSNFLKPHQKGYFNPKSARVCSIHFHSGQPSELFDTENIDWAPTLQLAFTNDREKEQFEKRATQAYKRFQRIRHREMCAIGLQLAKEMRLDEYTTGVLIKRGLNSTYKDNTQVQKEICETHGIQAPDYFQQEVQWGSHANDGGVSVGFEHYFRTENVTYNDVCVQTDISFKHINDLEVLAAQQREKIKSLERQVLKKEPNSEIVGK